MKYAKMLMDMFPEITLELEDLLLLESFQINYLPERIPQKQFAAIIREYPIIKEFMLRKNPDIEHFIHSVLNSHENLESDKHIDEFSNEFLWEIADLIVYNKHPELYDEKVAFDWTIDEIIEKKILKEKVVADVGAGSGRLSFMLARYAETVYAIEPLSRFRDFIRQKSGKENLENLYAIDGFLDSIPFPDNTFDVLFTSNSIGWNIEKELQEIERVLKPNGQAIHLIRISGSVKENPVHDKLVSSEWQYHFIDTNEDSGLKIKYIKSVLK